MTSSTTLPRLLHRNAASFARHPALREKRGGIWQVLTWAEHAAIVSRFAGGLAARGFGRNHRLAVIGDNRPRLYAALLAAQSLGGAGVPISPDAEPDWIAQVLTHSGASVVVAEDAEQMEKIVAVKDRLPTLRLVVQTAAHGMRQIERDWLKSFDTIAGTGGAATDRSEPGGLALLLYAGEARATMLSHADLLAAADALSAAEESRRTDETLAWLPMCWFADVLASQTLALTAGFTCNCPENPETVWRDLREIGPTILVAPPRIWERMLNDIDARAAQATPLKRALFAGFRAVAERAEQRRAAGEGVSLPLRLKLGAGEALAYAPMRDQMGLRRLRWASTGGEALPPRVLHAFRALGVNLKQGDDMPEPARSAWEPAHA